MAAGDTDVSIANRALLLLGHDSITSFSDGSAAASAVSQLYPETRDVTLGLYPWSFTIAKLQLAKDTATPVSEWDYQFTLPSDMLTGVPRAVHTSATTRALFKNWEINRAADGLAKLFTNATEIYIDYQAQTGEDRYPQYFVQLLTYQLAAILAEVITDQITKAAHWHQVALGPPSENGRGGFFRQAANMDSAGRPSEIIAEYMLTDVR